MMSREHVLWGVTTIPATLLAEKNYVKNPKPPPWKEVGAKFSKNWIRGSKKVVNLEMSRSISDKASWHFVSAEGTWTRFANVLTFRLDENFQKLF